MLRRLTLLDVKRSQGFPGDWALCGTKADSFKQIGNAVPTLFGELLGKALRAHLAQRSRKKAVLVGWPKEFDRYIRYTIDDQARNGSARKVHLQFARRGESARGKST